MQYLSTRGHPDRKRFCEILLEGLAPDGGLYLPEAYPQVDAPTLTRWRAVLAERDIDDIHRAVDYLNLTTQWAQSRATATDLEEVTDRLLLAMHDLRSVLVRKKTERIMNDDATPMIEESQA